MCLHSKRQKESLQILAQTFCLAHSTSHNVGWANFKKKKLMLYVNEEIPPTYTMDLSNIIAPRVYQITELWYTWDSNYYEIL